MRSRPAPCAHWQRARSPGSRRWRRSWKSAGRSAAMSMQRTWPPVRPNCSGTARRTSPRRRSTSTAGTTRWVCRCDARSRVLRTRDRRTSWLSAERLQNHAGDDEQQDADVDADDEQDAVDQRERLGMLRPVLLGRPGDLLGERRQDADAGDERRGVADETGDHPEVVPADVAVDHHRDAHQQHDETGGREELLADECSLAGDRHDLPRIVQTLGAEAEDGQREPAADPEHRDDDVHDAEDRVPIRVDGIEGEDQPDDEDRQAEYRSEQPGPTGRRRRSRSAWSVHDGRVNAISRTATRPVWRSRRSRRDSEAPPARTATRPDTAPRCRSET